MVKQCPDNRWVPPEKHFHKKVFPLHSSVHYVLWLAGHVNAQGRTGPNTDVLCTQVCSFPGPRGRFPPGLFVRYGERRSRRWREERRRGGDGGLWLQEPQLGKVILSIGLCNWQN